MDFDMSSINKMYTEFSAKNATTDASKIGVNKDFSKASDEELMDACKKFEAYFLEQCFKEMMKTTNESETSSASSSTLLNYYKDNFIQEISEESTDKQGLGLAQQLYEQMKRNYGI